MLMAGIEYPGLVWLRVVHAWVGGGITSQLVLRLPYFLSSCFSLLLVAVTLRRLWDV